MSFVSSSGVIKPSQSTSVRRNYLSSKPTGNIVTTQNSNSTGGFCIVNIPLDSLQGIESISAVPFFCVLGSGVQGCSYEKGKLSLSCASNFNNAYISYGILDLQEGGIGSVISSMKKEDGSFTHLLYDNAVMICTIYLS
ncbi:hypothetical protein BQ9231_00057 [Cedratvirus lausannensis]|uniref:Uncharacterized protein n=2 Tax=Pithoviruses TaxID=2023203 RepID=A0A285Q1Q9_9VIRU|nr:hypothetical protein Cbor_538 [Cedratvirus borely]WIL03606.1 hypothetical protein Cplu_539 [Cedratvirus plubellavi]SOB73940.1 hypothetical protein BQ9231_00057 [Cedratvirus lausannensis]SPN79878.1 Hypothetical protein ZAZAV_567 [Cedratvirus Zaza IHUMI]